MLAGPTGPGRAASCPARFLLAASDTDGSGLEELLRAIDVLDVLDAPPEPDELERMAAPYGVDLDMAGTMAVLERHALRF